MNTITLSLIIIIVALSVITYIQYKKFKLITGNFTFTDSGKAYLIIYKKNGIPKVAWSGNPDFIRIFNRDTETIPNQDPYNRGYFLADGEIKDDHMKIGIFTLYNNLTRTGYIMKIGSSGSGPSINVDKL